MRIVVVLPEPFGPRKPTISPSATLIDTWSTTVLSPKRLTSPLTSIAFMACLRHCGERGPSPAELHIHDLPRLQPVAAALRPRLDEVDELLPRLERVDDRRRELGAGET
jgi:hypothetical protein